VWAFAVHTPKHGVVAGSAAYSTGSGGTGVITCRVWGCAPPACGWIGTLVIVVSVEFVTGGGGAGFHSPGPALTTGRGGYFGGDPRPAPVRGESPLIPWTGPRFSPPVLTGTRLGNRRGRGHRQGTLKKHAPPRAVQRGGAGSWAGGPRFSGPRRPRNEH